MKRWPLALLAVIASGACQSDLDATRDPITLDRPFFDCKVQPVLTKLCSALACHGAGDRYFTVYARNRLRDGGDESERKTFMRLSERDHNYIAAGAFVDLAHPDDSLLLRKPLEQRAGGYYHVGATLYGGDNVFADTMDPDYQVLAQWIAGATEDPTCTEPGSNL